MLKNVRRNTIILLSCSIISAQVPQQGSLEAVLDKAEASTSLSKGAPSHAEMTIAGAGNEPEYKATISLDWASPSRYRVEVRSQRFHQVRTVDDTQISERTEGDFYPGWLHGFAKALMDPLFSKALVTAPNAQLGGSRSMSSNSQSLACVQRNDRPGGITDDLTWSGLCISGSGEPNQAYDFTAWMDYSNFKSFGKQRIATSYESFTGNYDKLLGKVTVLRPLSPAEIEGIHVAQPTPKDKQLTFTFLSTTAEEARLESAKPFDWPPVREGKTEGYMIIHAVTDVNGQVRESSKHNSDNPGLEEAGMQAAMGYKFKPMLVDGVPAQVEMPLVLHFKTTQGVPLPFLKGDEVSKVSQTCHSPIVLPKGVGEPGRHYHVKVSVDETGKRTGETFPDGYPDFGYVGRTVQSCNFGIYRLEGKPTYYHVELEFIAPH